MLLDINDSGKIVGVGQIGVISHAITLEKSGIFTR